MVIKANSPKIAKQIIIAKVGLKMKQLSSGKNNATASAEKPLWVTQGSIGEREIIWQVASEPQNNTAAPQSNFNL
jgi:hypothetical protein